MTVSIVNLVVMPRMNHSKGVGVTKIHDITIPIGPSTPLWPDDPDISLEPASRIANGDVSNVTLLTMGTHSGTHIDPPAHFFDGTATVDRIELSLLCGPAFVAEINAVERIGREHLDAAKIPPGVRRLLLKTSNSSKELMSRPDFDANFVSLSPSGARWIVDHGVQVVGIDYLSVEAHSDLNHDTHRVLLGNRLSVLEGLDLRSIDTGHYLLFALPLKIARGDGAPVRAVLVENI